jgi:hypothetical protein
MPGTSKTGFRQVKIMVKEFVGIDRKEEKKLAFGQVGEKKLRQRL